MIEGGITAMEALFTAITGCFSLITGFITAILAWAVTEPLILIGLTASVAYVCINLFGESKHAARA